jgi:hypothetical protein
MGGGPGGKGTPVDVRGGLDRKRTETPASAGGPSQRVRPVRHNMGANTGPGGKGPGTPSKGSASAYPQKGKTTRPTWSPTIVLTEKHTD